MFRPVLAIIRLSRDFRASYMHARARGVEISTYACLDKPNQNSQIKHYKPDNNAVCGGWGVVIKF